MIVYGQPQRQEEPARLLAGLQDLCAALANTVGGTREELARRLLIAAGELAQGLLDAAFAVRGIDEWEELEQLSARLTMQAAQLLLDAGQGPAGTVETLQALSALPLPLPLPETVTVSVPEGYAFYALFPELYARAAERFRASCDRPVAVLGLRSIGTSLAAVVAAAVRSAVLPITLRPVGHPFRREVRVGPRLRRLVFDLPPQTHYAIVDEGPGLSGSSFGATADWLEDGGISSDRIHFFPGHGGDLGPQASVRHRERWRRCRRHVVTFEDWLSSEARPSFLTGISDMEDVGGGKWRHHLFPAERDWPPANPPQERRKYLFRAGGRSWLAKFIGLGCHGDAKLSRARILERAELIPPMNGLRQGFLISEWLSAGRPLSLHAKHDRSALIRTAAEYLALLYREFPAGQDIAGATPATLLDMATANTAEWFGPELAAHLDLWRERLPAVGGRLRRVCTDNRMHSWEWLVLPDGRVLKTDALDHHTAHDCIGAQDLAWDVVGAAVEWDLSPSEQDDLDRRLADLCGYRPDALVRDFYLPCYLAFQLGYYSMAAGALADGQPAEALRLRTHAERYAVRLRRALSEGLLGRRLP